MKNRNLFTTGLLLVLLLTCLCPTGIMAESFTEMRFETEGTVQGEQVFFEEGFGEGTGDFFEALPEVFSDAGEADPEEEESGEEAGAEARRVLLLPTELENWDEYEPWMAAPIELKAVPKKNGTVAFSWTPAVSKLPKNVKYYVYDVDEKTGAAVQLGKATTGKTLTVKNVAGGEHTFQVRAEHIDPKTKKETYGKLSNKVKETVESARWKEKPKVTGAQYGGTIRLTWTVKEPADVYQVMVYKYGIPYPVIVEEPVFIEDKPVPGKNVFTVQPISSGGEAGKVSAKVTVNYSPEDPWKTAPLITGVTQSGDGKAIIRWKAAVETEYYILTGGKKTVTVETSALTQTGVREYEYAVETARTGTKTFKVTPAKKNEKGKLVKGKASKGYKLKLSKDLAKLSVTNVRATAGTGGIRISWENHNPEAECFWVTVYRGNFSRYNQYYVKPGKTQYETLFENLPKGVYGYYIETVLKKENEDDPTVMIRDVQPQIDTVEVTTTGMPVRSLSLDTGFLEIENGENGYLYATVTPSDAANPAVAFYALDPEIVSITPFVSQDGAVLKGRKVGRTTVMAVTKDFGFTAACQVVVKPASVTHVLLNKTKTTIGLGEKEQLIPTVYPEEAWNKGVTWSSSLPNVVSVDNNGVVTGLRTGTSQVTVRTNDGGKTSTCNVTVTDVTGITVSPVKISLPVNGSKKLTAAISPANAVNKKIVWSSSNESIATVDSDGVVKAKAKGTAKITAMSFANHDCTATCDVTVDQVTVNLNLYSYDLMEGTNPTVQLTATVSPSSYSVTWKSSNPSVATVDAKGLVTITPGGKKGYTTVTATAGGVSMSCHITANPITYRALVIGNSYTKSSYLAGPRYDVDNLEDVLKSLSKTKYTVTKKKDMDFGDDNLTDVITEAFSSADENDVSLFYYSGHGSSNGSIIGQDDTHISPSSLRTALDTISGRKVVFADSCYSGKIISKSADSHADDSDDEEGFEEAFLAAFSVNSRSSSDLADSDYYVITASQGSSTSIDNSYYSYIDTTSSTCWPGFAGYKGYYRKDDDIYRFNKDGYAFRVKIDGAAGQFTYSLVNGLGYEYADRFASISVSDLKADKNGDKKVTFAELYSYVKSDMSDREVSHTPQVYPKDSDAVFFAR